MTALRQRLRDDWRQLRPFKQALFVVVWSFVALGSVWLVPRGVFPVDPEIVYQGQVLMTALFAGAFAEPVHSAAQYESIEEWEAAVLDVDIDEWTAHLEAQDG